MRSLKFLTTFVGLVFVALFVTGMILLMTSVGNLDDARSADAFVRGAFMVVVSTPFGLLLTWLEDKLTTLQYREIARGRVVDFI